MIFFDLPHCMYLGGGGEAGGEAEGTTDSSQQEIDYPTTFTSNQDSNLNSTQVSNST